MPALFGRAFITRNHLGRLEIKLKKKLKKKRSLTEVEKKQKKSSGFIICLFVCLFIYLGTSANAMAN